MSLAMIVGCLIAGSTPLGGAVVAFPVAVLVIKFTPVQGGDFAVLIQSIGMTAAAYLIAVKKSHMVDSYLVQTSCVANTLGVILGFCLLLPGFWINVTYMTYTLVFAGVLFYKHAVAGKADPVTYKVNDDCECDGYSWTTILSTVGLFVSGIIGGILASKLGSGSDTMAYVFGMFVHNPLFAKKGLAIAESSLTVSSVVIMAYTTVVVTVIRLAQGDVDRQVFLCWGAVPWIVVFGAPIGSLLLTPQRETFFRRLFYVLAAVQFITFAILKIKGNLQAWTVIAVIVFAAISGVSAHAVLNRNNRAAIRASDKPENDLPSEKLEAELQMQARDALPAILGTSYDADKNKQSLLCR